MSDYPLIADHGLIGNMQTAALVTTDGTIDWFCAPRFDSPSVFGCLLDNDHGGHLRTRPTADAFTQHQLYYPDTAILVTRFQNNPAHLACRQRELDLQSLFRSHLDTCQSSIVRLANEA